jgi:hypothetical protein
LRGNDEKRLRKGMRFAVDGDLRFIHGFEQCGLRARRGAVDFVSKDHVGEERAWTKFKFTGIGLVDADADYITWQKVGSELHTLKAAVKRFGEGLGKRGFAHAGYVFNEQVAAGQKRDQGELNGFFFAVNGTGDRALKLRNDLRGGGRHWLKTPDNPVTKDVLPSDSMRGKFRANREAAPRYKRAISSAVRALASHARGQRFKSFIAHHFPIQGCEANPGPVRSLLF